MKFDFNALKAKMIEKYGSQNQFAEAFGTSENTMSRKMQVKRHFHEMISLKYAIC